MSTMIYYASFSKYLEEQSDRLEEIKDQYINLLSYLTETENMDVNLFLQQAIHISLSGETIVGYIKNETDGTETIVATGTIFFEPKIIHGGRYVGHIEDIVVLPMYRSQGIAQTLMGILKELATDKNCYKVILECSPDLVSFYQQVGYEKKGYQMAQYFP